MPRRADTHAGECHCLVCRGLDRLFPTQGHQLTLFAERKPKRKKAGDADVSTAGLGKHFVAGKGRGRRIPAPKAKRPAGQGPAFTHEEDAKLADMIALGVSSDFWADALPGRSVTELIERAYDFGLARRETL